MRTLARARPLSQPGDVADAIVLDAAEAWARALVGDADHAGALLARARTSAAGIDMPGSTEELDYMDAKVSALVGDLERARGLLSGLASWNEERGRRRHADRFRRDLAALDTPGPD